ncbi:putative carbonic anhydrase 3 [Drosophila pseudoobscura]|uniref:Carbonic anhydrase 3 n=1 Tax=Drosophila pseudoobscura pseudoobscura TaxID=46245 RepID=A0A6I8UX18_DROPS|nr:putative carbonic anhydrase 3 [Drosophila pseudoobscura]
MKKTMPQLRIYQILVLLLPLSCAQEPPPQVNLANEIRARHWSYIRHGQNWRGICHTGEEQSPIRLDAKKSVFITLPDIQFENYDEILRFPVILQNNGYTAHMDIPETRSNRRPYITGGMLQGRYMAESLQFHWGSSIWTAGGAEHWIEGKHHDVEMQIVHRNFRYPNLSEAVKHKDGLAILAVIFRIDRGPGYTVRALKKITDQLLKIRRFKDQTLIEEDLTLMELLGDLNTKRFFTYSGSLTTPDCQEVVTWTVFSQTLPIGVDEANNFWNLTSFGGQKLLANYRYVQNLHDRTVFVNSNR